MKTQTEQITESITVAFNGRETTAVILSNGIPFVGTSRCNSVDKYSKEIGSNIALARAARALADSVESVWTARAVTKKEWAAKHPNK